MRKKLILVIATLGLALGAYFVFASGDRVSRPRPSTDPSHMVRRFVSQPATTQATQSLGGEEMTFSPGDQTRVRIYDDVSGRLKYQFEAATWEPTTQTEFRLTKLLIQLYMPKGEITYITADEAEITVSRKGKSRVDPKRGWLRGHVKVTIDRSTAAWREANPQIADRFAHPDDLINIDLADARFDLDLCELVCDGDVVVDASEARIEQVRGLTVQWDQVDNRIDVLRFKQGGLMALRRGGKMVEFTMPGMERDAKKPGSATKDKKAGVAANEIAAARDGGEVPRARANRPTAVAAISADQAAEEIRLEGGAAAANRPRSLADASPHGAAPAGSQPVDLGSADAVRTAVESLKSEARSAESGELIKTDVVDAAAVKGGRRRIQTYRAVFTNQVIVEQKDGLRTIGKIDADKLEINFDFGKNTRDLTRPEGEEASTSRPASAVAMSSPPKTTPPAPASHPSPPSSPPLPEDRTKLVLTWNGPLEMRPLRGDPAQQTGQRFDAIATGAPVRVQSDQGTASCRQLVYRHERKQIWLSSGEGGKVEMAVSPTRRMEGGEVFFDQKRGLARIEGSGLMIDDRVAKAESGDEKPSRLRAMAGTLSPANGRRETKGRESVNIRWGRGVDLEIGNRTVQRMNSSTGLKEDKDREFLRRAWFHGEVAIDQGEEHLTADEVAVTFGLPLSNEEMADHIQHLSMSGSVRLKRGDDLITADRLDTEMTVTPEKRNIPKSVDADGNVLAQQGQREIHARQMHVEMAETIGKPAKGKESPADLGKRKLGIETLDALGEVLVLDPDHNMKISKADSLKSTMRNGNELVRSTIVSADPKVYAQARYADMAIHGHRIEIDMDKSAIDVPGPGAAWMNSKQDFGGRKLAKPSPVKTTWTDRMEFRMARNYGVFLGHVHSESDEFSLNSDKLTVRFAKAPPEPKGPPPEKGRVGALRELIAGKPKSAGEELTILPGEQKRPSSLVAEGHVEALSSTYAPSGPNQERGRLLSRFRIASEQVAADLVREQLNVPHSGTLLIEDYQFDAHKGALPSARSAIESTPLMSTMRNEGPSQTLVTWDNSMDYFVDRALVVFDRNVSMVHRSGQEMALRDELATAMSIDHESLRRIGAGRRATLTCGNLLLEFQTTDAGKVKSAVPTTVRATDLKRLIAKEAVHLQDGTKSLMGEYLQYLQETDEVRLEGNGVEARIIDQDEKDQRLSMWKGPLLIWNRRTNQIEAPKATIRSSRR